MGANLGNGNSKTWAALARRLAPACLAIVSLLVFACLAMNEWRHGVKVESWEKLTATVIDRRQVEVRRADERCEQMNLALVCTTALHEFCRTNCVWIYH